MAASPPAFLPEVTAQILNPDQSSIFLLLPPELRRMIENYYIWSFVPPLSSFSSGGPSAKRRIYKELAALVRTPVEGVEAHPCGDDLFKWDACIHGPVGSPYEGGVFLLSISFPPVYPFKPPDFRFHTKLYHPNVSSSGYVCIGLCSSGHWSPALNATKILNIFRCLLADPNSCIEHCQCPEITKQFEKDRPAFEATAREWTQKYAKP